MSIEWIRKEIRNQTRDLIDDLCLISRQEAGPVNSEINQERNGAIRRILQITKIRITLISGEIIDTNLELFGWDDDSELEAIIIPATSNDSLRYVFSNAIATFEIWRPTDAVLNEQYKIAQGLGIAKPIQEAPCFIN